MSERDHTGPDTGRRHTAGLFDVRIIIGALLTLYGVVVLVTGLVGGSGTADSHTDGDTIDTWVGAALLVIGILFVLWARARPVVVDEAQVERDAGADDAAGGRAG
jgi:hypothetical protein